MRILVVEDDYDIRTLVGVALRHSGASIENAADGDEAIRALHAGPFDAVILDLMLPKRNGFVIADEIGKLVPKPKLIVLSALTRYFTDRFPDDAVLLQKPFDVDKLCEVVGSLRPHARPETGSHA
jgi:DNA-binding response OmpR family regulator